MITVIVTSKGRLEILGRLTDKEWEAMKEAYISW